MMVPDNIKVGDEFFITNERNGRRERFLRTLCPVCNETRDVKKRNRFASPKTICSPCNKEHQRKHFTATVINDLRNWDKV